MYAGDEEQADAPAADAQLQLDTDDQPVRDTPMQSADDSDAAQPGLWHVCLSCHCSAVPDTK